MVGADTGAGGCVVVGAPAAASTVFFFFGLATFSPSCSPAGFFGRATFGFAGGAGGATSTPGAVGMTGTG